MDLPGYDAWKTRSPYEEELEPQTDPGPCELCRGTGVIITNRAGRYVGGGILPDPAPRGLLESDCPNCGGTGEIADEEDEEG